MKKILSARTFLASACFSMVALIACNDNGTNDGNDSDTTNTTVGMDTAGTVTDTSGGMHAMATLSGTKTDTAVTGAVHFTQNGNMVKLKLDIEVPKKANSSVAVHIHAMGDCGDMGKHAGGHWNPTNENHGKWGTAPFHSGDIGNINLDASGKGSIELESDRWSIGGDSTKNILNKTIIIHSGVDDYKSQPTGNSGERIGCGVINKQ